MVAGGRHGQACLGMGFLSSSNCPCPGWVSGILTAASMVCLFHWHGGRWCPHAQA